MIKRIVAVIIMKCCRIIFRYFPTEWGKPFIWRKILQPHVNWRTIRTKAKTKTGLKFNVMFPDVIQKYIYYFGIWEPVLTKYCLDNLSPGDTFIDIGANIGYYTCMASRAVEPGGIVISIEPSPSIYHLLMRNIKQNELTNVKAINMAVHNRKTSLTLYKANEENIGATTSNQDIARACCYQKEAEVCADSLDKIVTPDVLYGAKLVKIDVEGAEWFVIDGIRERLDKFSDDTDWLIEILPKAIEQQGDTVETFISNFVRCGYKAYKIKNDYSPESYWTQMRNDNVIQLSLKITGLTDVLLTKRELLPASDS